MTSLIRRLPFAHLLPRSRAQANAARQARAPAPAAAVRSNYPELEEVRGAARRRQFSND